MLLLSNGYGLQHPQWHVDETHAPGFCRVYYILGGDITYREGPVPVKLNPGYLYIFPASRAYSIAHTAENCIECLWFHIDFLPTVVDSLLEIPVLPQSSLYHMLQAMIAQHLDAEGRDACQRMLIDALMQYLQERHLQNYPRKLEAVIGYLQAHCLEELSVAQLSAHFGYSTEYFIRMFQKNVHLTPYQYLIGCRLHAAAELLLQERSVKETALLCGFRDAKTFGQCFQQRYHCAPSRFKSRYTRVP